MGEPLLLFDVLHHGAIRDPGVVDEEVDTTPVALSLGDDRLAFFCVRYIEGANSNVLGLTDRMDIEARERLLSGGEKH